MVAFIVNFVVPDGTRALDSIPEVFPRIKPLPICFASEPWAAAIRLEYGFLFGPAVVIPLT